MEFLARLNIMDYSLLLGVHDLERAVEDAQQATEEETDEEDYDSGGSAGIALTPPDSPGCMRQVTIMLDVYQFWNFDTHTSFSYSKNTLDIKIKI